jgi:coproporphyrinogen III oxidase-like Fe-S oxidoreductase
VTAAAGLPAYEISNHARPGEEARHNLAYWRYQPYAGIGPGAHGRRGAAATLRHRKPETWLAAVARHGHGIAEETRLGDRDRRLEALLMGLRLSEGVELERVGPALDLTAVARLERHGFLARAGGRLLVKPPARLVLDRLLAEIAAL